MKVAVLGLGYWGPNLVRNFLANTEVEEVIGCDLSEERLQFIKSKYPSVKTSNKYSDILNSDIDIIAVATPVSTHYNFAKSALESGKHIWVEKPFTATSQQSKELIKLADSKNLKIFVDHTFIYTGAIIKIKEIVDNGELGSITYFDSVRVNLGLFQHDVNVIWDLAPHDLSIMKYILPKKKITGITANGIANYYDLENIAHISVYFENNCHAHFHVNWTSPVKIRRMMICGTKKMLVYDDMENIEKIKIYDSSVSIKTTENLHDALVQYRIGDMYSPKVKQTEALSLAVQEFIDSIKENRKPLTSGEDGLDVVEILEASEKSIKNVGKFVELN